MPDTEAKHRRPTHGRKPHWWNLSGAWKWTAGVITAIIVATGSTFASGLGQHLLSSVFGHKALNLGPDPVLVDSAAYVDGNNPIFSFSRVLTKSQVRALTQNAYFDGSVPKRKDWATYVNLVAEYGGAPNTATIQIVLQGNSRNAVTVTGIQVVKHCRPPLTGTLLYSPSAGAPPDIRLWYNLDILFSGAEYQNHKGKYVDFFSQRTIELKPGEVNTLVVSPVTYGHYCRFTFQMAVDDGTRKVSESITNGGKPFVETAVAGVYSPLPLSFSIYKTIYAGGVASPTGDGRFVRVDPKKYNTPGALKIPSTSVP